MTSSISRYGGPEKIRTDAEASARGIHDELLARGFDPASASGRNEAETILMRITSDLRADMPHAGTLFVMEARVALAALRGGGR